MHLEHETMMGPESQSDAVDSNITLQTQAQILQSDSLALQVIQELNLEKSPDFRTPASTPLGGSWGCSHPPASRTGRTYPWTRRRLAARM